MIQYKVTFFTAGAFLDTFINVFPKALYPAVGGFWMVGFKLTLDSFEFLSSKAAFVFFCRGTCFLVVDGCLVGT